MTVSAPERSGNSASVFTPAAPRNPRFIVQQTRAGHHQLVDLQSDSGRSCDGVDYTDFDTARAERDQRNAIHWAQATIDERLQRLPRLDKLVVFFGSAETQQLMADILTADEHDAAAWLEDLVDEFDRAYAEATAGA